MTPSVDPLAGSTWSDPATVAGFTQAAPNQALLGYADAVAAASPGRRVLDLGCGAGRNAVALARAGARVIAVDEDAEQVGAARRTIDA
ncbi:MAG TPA: methyltransferase domain-containing protein, partial [Longimicrobiales bacterium]|nr:methyltransferase domain-containing protein [Longimicrobiales bacterium]